MSLPWIRNRYTVPAFRGRKVKYEGKTGTVTSGKGGHIRIRFGDERVRAIVHPTDPELDYLLTPDEKAMIAQIKVNQALSKMSFALM